MVGRSCARVACSDRTRPLAPWLCAVSVLCLYVTSCTKDTDPTRCGTGARSCDGGATAAGGSGGTAPIAGRGGNGGQTGQPNPAGRPGGPIVLDAGPRPDAGRPPSDDCQTADVTAQRVIPTVVLVIDQSGSMTSGFSGGTRWNVLRDFLLRDDGLLKTFETQVRFGLALYSAEASRPIAQCPLVTSVTPAVMNFAAIRDAYRMAEPVGETPTGDSIDKVVASLPTSQVDNDNAPVVLLLATDGEPDRCEQLNPQNGQEEAVAAVKRAFDLGIRTYIMSVGEEVSAAHQQAVANAGIGRDASNPAPYWTAGDDASLRTALTQIISEQVSCEVTLAGELQRGDPCEGTVELNGTKLECNGANGWKLADPSHILLMGKACEDFKSLGNASVRARFPCSVDIVF